MDDDSDYVPSPPLEDYGAPSNRASSSSSAVRWRPLPRATYRSIEYPGPMAHPDLIFKVVSQAEVDDCFNANVGDPRQLEMRYRPEQRSAVPVRGSRVLSQKVLVKVVKRKKRTRSGQQPADEQGVFTADIVGSIPQTVRFRSMADYQYTPSQDGRIAQLTQALIDLDYDAILDYKVPPLDEVYFVPNGPGEDGHEPAFPFRSVMELQPTPMSSSRHLPHIFNYKMNANTVEEKVWDERTQEYRTRYVNKSRSIGWAMTTIGHAHPVPSEPEEAIRERIPKLDQRIYSRLLELLAERPVWMRYSLLAQFSEQDRYEIESNKMYLPAIGFTYGAGPYWKTIVRWGYDPCTEREAHKYQRIYIYLCVNRGKNSVLNPAEDVDEEELKRPSFWWENEQNRLVSEGLRPPIDPKRVYVFDGLTLHRNKPDYQMVDIVDPLIERYIYEPASLRETCDPHSGWYHSASFEVIKALMRVRYAYLRDNNRPAPAEDCAEIIETYEQYKNSGEDSEGIEALLRRMAQARQRGDRKSMAV